MQVYADHIPRYPKSQQAVKILESSKYLAEMLVTKYRSNNNILWGQREYTIADAQEVLDALGPTALTLFAQSAKLGAFLEDTLDADQRAYFNWSADEVASPVAYTVENGRIVLDVNAEYPGQFA